MNILLIVCDTLRADHLGCYGYFRDTSPNIDRIAREGVLFEDFYNAGCPTGPAFTSIITGLQAIHHKYYKFGEPNIRQVDDRIFTVAEILRAMGYTTAAFDNLMTLMSGRGKHFVRGYEFYVNCGPDAFDLAHELRAEQLNRRLVPWLREYAHERFFLFVHYWDPHFPYNQPEEYRNLFKHEVGTLSDLEIKEAPAGYEYVPGWGTKEQIIKEEKRFLERGCSVDLYDGEIAYVDKAIGEVMGVLEDQGVLNETLVIVTSDHGEQLGQHYNFWGHDGLHDADVHIPLIMRYPKRLPKCKEVSGFCQQIDLLPTILDLTEGPTDVLEIDGQSIMPLLKDCKIRNWLFMEHTNGQRAIRTDEWKLLADEWTGRPRRELELYNVERDPMETINLAKVEEEKAAELRSELQNWVRANLKEGEPDPVIYDDYGEKQKRRIEYRQKMREFVSSIGSGYREGHYLREPSKDDNFALDA